MKQPFQAIDEVSAWRAEHRDKHSFAVDLSPRQLGAFDEALRGVQDRGMALHDMTRADFPLSAIESDVDAWRERVLYKEGLVILRGFPVDRYSPEEMGLVHWGLGTHFGTAMSQSVMGDRLGHVVNVGGKDRKERAYRNSTELAMHTDACDVVAMMCLQTAIRGGYSGYVSAMAIYNEVLERRPDLLAVLFEGFHYHRFGEELPGESPCTERKVPVFSRVNGYLSVNYLRAYIEMAAQEMALPLNDAEVEALDLVDAIAHDPRFALQFMTLPGEAVLFNNLTVLHNRTAFEDSPQPAKQRHLLRLWLVAHDRRPRVDTLRLYEGEGIAEQQGRSTYFQGRPDYEEFAGRSADARVHDPDR